LPMPCARMRRRDFIAVEQRHADIEQRDFGQVPLGGRRARGSRGALKTFVATQLQNRRQGLQRVGVVVATSMRRRTGGASSLRRMPCRPRYCVA